jgi:hypothetical protein
MLSCRLGILLDARVSVSDRGLACSQGFESVDREADQLEKWIVQTAQTEFWVRHETLSQAVSVQMPVICYLNDECKCK